MIAAAIMPAAIFSAKEKKVQGTCTRPGHGRSAPSAWAAGSLARLAILALWCAATPSFGASNKVRITNVADVAFGTLANLSVDAVSSHSLCVYSATSTSGYSITASGTGPGGAFELSSGLSSLPYVVQWSGSAGQSSGIQLTPNVPLTGQLSSANQQTCSSGPSASASLVVVLRSAALSSAMAGTYNGTLTLLVSPE